MAWTDLIQTLSLILPVPMSVSFYYKRNKSYTAVWVVLVEWHLRSSYSQFFLFCFESVQSFARAMALDLVEIYLKIFDTLSRRHRLASHQKGEKEGKKRQKKTHTKEHILAFTTTHCTQYFKLALASASRR